jgi:zinc transport system substrate-binding protein
LRAFVSVSPQRTFVRRIAGTQVQVEVLAQPGQDPHTYEPTPRQVTKLTQADFYVRIGVPFEDAWLPRIRAANPHMDVVDLRAGLDLSPPGGSKGQRDLDPHLWTSPLLVKRMGRYLCAYLSRRDPSGRAFYQAHYATFAADLERLDRDIRSTLAGLEQRSFMVFHPAWGAFAAAYGLTQIAIEQFGKEPGAKALGRLIDQARRQAIRVIFVQPQLDRKAARTLAAAIGGRVEVLDPLAEDYFANLRRVARRIAEARRP